MLGCGDGARVWGREGEVHHGAGVACQTSAACHREAACQSPAADWTESSGRPFPVSPTSTFSITTFRGRTVYLSLRLFYFFCFCFLCEDVCKEAPQPSQEPLVVVRLSSPSPCPSTPTVMSSFTLAVGSVVTRCQKYCETSLRWVVALITLHTG